MRTIRVVGLSAAVTMAAVLFAPSEVLASPVGLGQAQQNLASLMAGSSFDSMLHASSSSKNEKAKKLKKEKPKKKAIPELGLAGALGALVLAAGGTTALLGRRRRSS